MTSRSTPDWLKTLVAKEGDPQLISTEDKDSLIDALTAAQSPKELDPHRQAQLLSAALGTIQPVAETTDPFAAPTDAERCAALKLAESLDSDDLAIALRAAYRPQPIAADMEHRIRFTALSRASRRRGRFTRGTLWGALAAAASVVLWLATSNQQQTRNFDGAVRSPLNYAQSRSTDTLFSEPFARVSASERIDRIAQVRRRELRENTYLKWGVP